VITMTAPADVKEEVNGVTTVLLLSAPVRDRLMVVNRLLAMRLGLSVTAAQSVTEAIQLLSKQRFGLCLVDLADERGAIPAIRMIKAEHPTLPVSGILDPSRSLIAAEAIHAGVFDLIMWPFEERAVAALVAKVRDESVSPHRLDVPSHGVSEPLFAQSPAMRLAIDLARGAAAGRGGVMVHGEPGTGRSLVARAIHAFGPRAEGPFLTVDCSVGSPDEVEHALFGMTSEGRANGASRTSSERIGKNGAAFQARGGTLFLRNVIDAPARVQAKLARLIRDREATMSDKRTMVQLDWRAIAATDATVDSAVADGRLRRDLYDRVSHVRIDIPPLRRRREDIPMLALHVLRQLDAGRTPQGFSRSALALLSALPWAGNGRELRSLIETLVQIDRPVIQLEDVLERVRLDGGGPRMDIEGTLRDAKARFERDWISAMLMKHHGRVGEAAKALGIQRTNLYRKVRQLKVARTLLSARRSS